ncbi:hypothetical protein HYT18_04250 [Candidatus Microgenomates bacterium]|nr:hypothetical protein [Candidatus Microgenomates bacterium]
MIAKLLISPSLEERVKEIGKILASHIPGGNSNIKNHPDILYFPSDSKLGIEQARKIKEHFSLKPYSARGRGVVLEDASSLTPEAQNALLKILEEPPHEALLILGAPSDNKFLPTILSRCQVVRIQETADSRQEKNFSQDLEKLLKSDIQERFEYIEKLTEREEFFHSLIEYFHQNLSSHLTSGNTDYMDFVKEVLQAEEWAKQNVNIRAILEYLMLVMPAKL